MQQMKPVNRKEVRKVGRVFYLCNGQKEDCEKTDCYMNGGGCKHTSNVRYAKNFTLVSPRCAETYYEKEAVSDSQTASED